MMSRPFTRRQRFFIAVLGLVIGFLGGAFLVFQVLFLMKVIPHGGF